jgi:hypothetical protein
LKVSHSIRQRGEVVTYNARKALTAAGILSGPMPSEVEQFFNGLSQEEIDVIISVKSRLEAILPDVVAHSYTEPEASQMRSVDDCLCGAWSGSGSGGS